MGTELGFTRNADEAGEVPDGSWCEACGNDGMVMLLGTVTVGGRSYSRGATTCKWCGQGVLRYHAATAPSGERKNGLHKSWHVRWVPESQYGIEDIDPVGPAETGKRFVPTAAFLRELEAKGHPRAAICATFADAFQKHPGLKPAEWGEGSAIVGDLREAERVEENIRRARAELDRLTSGDVAA